VADDTANAAVSFQVANTLVPDTATVVNVCVRDHSFAVDEPAPLGGTDTAANPVEYALAALGSCQVITYQFWAAKLGIPLDAITVTVDGDLDLHRRRRARLPPGHHGQAGRAGRNDLEPLRPR
jgi:uncharacterized OsmC-like protein